MFKVFAAAILYTALSATCFAQSSKVCKDWTAVHRSGVLTVHGTCTVLAQATLTLSQAVPQGINPNILLLNLVIKEPIGMHSNAMLPKPVSFTKQTTKNYRSVTVNDIANIPVTGR